MKSPMKMTDETMKPDLGHLFVQLPGKTQNSLAKPKTNTPHLAIFNLGDNFCTSSRRLPAYPWVQSSTELFERTLRHVGGARGTTKRRSL